MKSECNNMHGERIKIVVLQFITVVAVRRDPPHRNRCNSLHCYIDCIISAHILWANFNVINNLSMFLCMLY